MRLVHLSDPHFGAHDPAVVAALPDAVRALRPDVVVVSGDFTMAGRRAEFRAARAFLDLLPPPLLLVPGNHDIPKLNQLFDRIFRPLQRYGRWLSPEHEPVLDLPEARLVGLNSSRAFGFYLDWSRGRLSREQIAVLAERFVDCAAGRLRVLVVHHPTIAPPKNRRDLVAPLDALKRALGAARIDFVLGGHFHRSYFVPLACGAGVGGDEWHALVSQVSTATSTRLQGEPNGFHLLAVNGGHAAAERHAWRRGRFERIETLPFSRDPARGWQPGAA